MQKVTESSESERYDLQRVLDSCAALVREYAWLLNCYVLDYFVDDHWAKLPRSWQVCFQEMDPTVLGNVLSSNSSKTVLPLSFLALLKAITDLSLSRQPATMKDFTSVMKKNSKNDILKDVFDKVPIEKSHFNSNSHLYNCHDHPSLQNLFSKHVKAKKQHEISRMCDVVFDTAHGSQCPAALDVGSGVGHLVRSLAYRHGLYAAGVERQKQLSEEARKLDLELEYTASKHLSPDAMKSLKRPIHVSASISPDTDFKKLGLPQDLREYGVVGLHPCGDLGPFLLRHFARSENVKFICLVGCCYMKLSCDEGKADCGYPMSRYLIDRPCRLSYASREIACHALETYVERLSSGHYQDLQVHAYRAALEVILVGIDRKLKHSGIRSIKHTNTLSFQRYCELALERLGLEVPSDQVRHIESRGLIAQWRRVVTFYTLRLILAPVVETIILLDRVLYLLEQGFSCDIRPMFDPRLSPRNHIIVGKKL